MPEKRCYMDANTAAHASQVGTLLISHSCTELGAKCGFCGAGTLARQSLPAQAKADRSVRPTLNRYFTSTTAPASVNFFLMVSASSLETPSFTVLGAPSTSSLASFKPRLVTSRTALITLILLAPTSFRTTANSVFSSAGAAAPPAAAPPPATITGAAAAADTPSRASSFLTSSAASRSDRPTIDSSICCRSAMLVLQYVVSSFFVIRNAGFQCDGSVSSRQTTFGTDRATPDLQRTKFFCSAGNPAPAQHTPTQA